MRTVIGTVILLLVICAAAPVGAQTPALTLVKMATPTTYGSVGDVISYSYLLTNSGNVTLSGPFTVTDDQATDVSCPATARLARLVSITCAASRSITQADLDRGSVTNVAQGHGAFRRKPVDSNTDTETVTAVQTPALTLVKMAMPTTYDSVGDVISYSYLLTNSGNVTLSGPFTVTDDQATDESCPAMESLAPLASVTCAASRSITQADLDSGSVTSVAQGHGAFGGNPVDSNTDTGTVTAVQTPALTMVKMATPTTYGLVGDVISYSYLLTNSGNVTLSGPFTVTDDQATDESCPATESLAPLVSITCTASRSITQADLSRGSVTSVAQARGAFGGNPVDSNTETEMVAVQRPVPPARPAMAPPARTPRIWVGLNGGSQTGTQQFGLSTTVSLYDEQGKLETTQQVQTGAAAEMSVLVRAWRDFSAGVAVSGLNSSAGGSISASLPHPLAYDRPRAVNATQETLRHRERALHFFAAWTRRLANKLDVTVSLGPSIFQVRQDILTGIEFSESAPSFTNVIVDKVNLVSLNEKVPSFNVGGDVTYMVTRFLGAGAFVRYAAAKLDVKMPDGTVELDVGGFQIGGGVRVRVW